MDAKRKLIYAGIIAAAAILVMTLYVFVISPKLVEPADTYSKAVKQYNDGDYMRSALMLESLGKYSDAPQLAKQAWKRAGDTAYEAGRYNEASACYVRGKYEEDVAKVDDCFIRLAAEEFEKLDPVKGEIYLNCVSEKTTPEAVDACRIGGLRAILAGTDDAEIIEAAVKLVEPCAEERRAEILEALAAGGENFLENLNIDAAEAAFAGALELAEENAVGSLNTRISAAYAAAANRAAEAGNAEAAERCMKLAEIYGKEAGPEEPPEEDAIWKAAALIDSGDYVGAYAILSSQPKDNAAVMPLLETVLFYYRRMPCAGANNAYVLLGMDGKAEFCGVGWGDQTPDWTKCRMVAMGYEPFALRLKSNGTVEAFGSGSPEAQQTGDWTDIILIAAGAKHSLGLRSDGTVVASGWNAYGQTNVGTWSGIIAVAAGKYSSFGLRSDGTVVACGQNDNGQCDVAGWSDIVAVSAGRAHTVGLRSDGTVVACGDNTQGQCAVGSWTDIVMVSASANHTVGLRADGTLVACGDNNNGQDEVSGITNAVAVACGNGYTLVVLADGSVVVLGDVG